MMHATVTAAVLSDAAQVALIQSGWNRTRLDADGVVFERRFRGVTRAKVTASVKKRLGDEWQPRGMLTVTEEEP